MAQARDSLREVDRTAVKATTQVLAKLRALMGSCDVASKV